MAPLKIRQRYIIPQAYGVAVEVESQQQLPPPSPSSSSCLDPPLLEPSPLSPFSHSSSFSSRTPSPAALWRHRLENLLWIASAAFIVYYGDFRSNLFALLVGDPRVRRTPFNIGLGCLLIDLGIFLYLVTRLRSSHRIEERLEAVAPGAIPAATMIGLSAFILFSIALWPIWSFLTVPMLFTLFMAFVVVAPYFPPFVNVKVEADAVRGLYVRSDSFKLGVNSPRKG